MDEHANFETPKKRTKNGKRTRPPSSASRAKRLKKDIWDPAHVMTSHDSPLVHADLRETLARQEAFDLLDPEERAKLINMLPNDARHVILDDEGRPSINPDFLKNDTNWHHAVSCVKEDIMDGRNDPEWLSQAYSAHEQRESGLFDSWKESELEEFWGLRHEVPAHILTDPSLPTPQNAAANKR